MSGTGVWVRAAHNLLANSLLNLLKRLVGRLVFFRRRSGSAARDLLQVAFRQLGDVLFRFDFLDFFAHGV